MNPNNICSQTILPSKNLQMKNARKRGHSPNRQLPNLPGRLQPSTFGVWVLNFCVRDGNRCATQPSPPDPACPNLPGFPERFVLRCIGIHSCIPQNYTGEEIGHFNKKSGPRRISAGPLHASRRSHSLPINLVVFKAPYYLSIWEASSQGGLHA